MLELKNITKVYKLASEEVRALNKINLKFRDSEFVSILGQSGSGKTTLLNIIGGLDKYSSGDLIINGVSTKKYKDKDWDTYRNHNVGFVFQSYNLIPHQTALQNVELALTLSGVSPKERRKKSIDILKKVGLAREINKRPNQMSGGQMQRVAIARALVNDPDVLLADEPTGALDNKTSLQIMDLLKEIAKDRLVVMVTHNPDLANKYSTRIINLFDGEITHDSNPYDKEEKEKEKKGKSKKTQMSFKTALSLSFNNLLTKKGRTILTAFAGSIGIIGIALILSLSHGIQNYIDKTEEETLSSYPLTIQKESIDIGSIIGSLTDSNRGKKHNDNKIHSVNIMGDMFTTMSQKVKSNDVKSFKKYIEKNDEIKKYTSSISYGYNTTLNIYKDDEDKLVRVNPTMVLDALGMMNSTNVSPFYSEFTSNYDVFYELLDNDELNKQRFDLVDGKWPENYNELVLTVDKNNQVSDYTLYSLGILSQDELKVQFSNMTSKKEVKFDNVSFETDELIGLTFKLLVNTDYYQKKNGVWLDRSKDDAYIQSKLKDSIELKIVGIIKPNEEAVATGKDYGMVGYRKELMTYLIDKINDSDIVKEQREHEDINVFTGQKFQNKDSFNINDLSKEEMAAMQKMSQEELALYVQTLSDNITATYEQNLRKIGAVFLDDPDYISIYPKDFDSKDKIVDYIDEYNKDKKEEDKIEYTDIVGVMMSSVSTIVNVISTVLIAFVAISLVVSSIMIAIITYISVIERTKEIGILRAMGASKKDISRVFNAETLIEGFSAGVFGIVITLLINLPINIIVKKYLNISNIASLPVIAAIILIAISILLTVIAGFIPAKIASKKDPVIALRTE